MINRFAARFFSLLLALMLVSCTLPELTPPADTVISTQPPFQPGVSETSTQAPSTIPEAVVISARNASALTMVNRSPVSNAQLLKWAEDGSSLSIASQNFDSNNSQVFGITVLSVPDLLPVNIYTNAEARVADIASNGKKAALVSIDENKLLLVDLIAGNNTVTPVSPDFLIGNATFSPDGNTIAITKKEAWEVVLFSTADLTELKTLTGFETAAPIFNAGFEASPQWMVWHARATLQLQEIETGNMGVALSHQDFLTNYALTRDGSIVATDMPASSGDSYRPGVTLWDANQGIELRRLDLTSSALCLDFSPDGSLLAVGVDTQLQIWDVADGTLISTLSGHAGQVTQLAFSADGKYLATAGNDNQLYLWQVVE